MESNESVVESASEGWRSYATICRLCLQKDGFMLGIFNNIHGNEKSIAKKIVDCTALSVSRTCFSGAPASEVGALNVLGARLHVLNAPKNHLQ